MGAWSSVILMRPTLQCRDRSNSEISRFSFAMPSGSEGLATVVAHWRCVTKRGRSLAVPISILEIPKSNISMIMQVVFMPKVPTRQFSVITRCRIPPQPCINSRLSTTRDQLVTLSFVRIGECLKWYLSVYIT